MNLEIGKYFNIKNDSNSFFNIKIIDNNTIDYIVLEKRKYVKSYEISNIEEANIIREISYDEYMRSIPSEHPDKINYLRKLRIKSLLKL